MGKEFQNPVDKKNKHLFHLFPMIKAHRRQLNDEFNFHEWHRYITENITEICKELNTRWLISICDTYLISGNEKQQSLAAIPIMFVNNLKFYITFNYILQDQWDGKAVKFEPNRELWDGVIMFNFNDKAHEDTLINMFDRIMEIYRTENDIFFKIYITIMIRYYENEQVPNDMYKRYLMATGNKSNALYLLKKDAGLE